MSSIRPLLTNAVTYIKSHDSESQGQEEAGCMQEMSELSLSYQGLSIF